MFRFIFALFRPDQLIRLGRWGYHYDKSFTRTYYD